MAMATDTKTIAEVVPSNDSAAFVSDDEDGPQTNILPPGWKLWGIVSSLMMAVFCMALDNTIISVAIPKITTDFHNLNDVGWYASAYLLPGCGMYTLFASFE